MATRAFAIGAVWAGLLLGAPVHAKVVAVDPGGFEVGDTVAIGASPAIVWALLLKPSAWWNPQHTWSGDAARLSLDARAGGCFCESLPSGGSVQHLTVVYVEPGRMLRLRGALGPLQDEAVDGPFDFRLKADAQGTALSWSYRLGGMLRGGGQKWAPIVDGVLGEQMARLKAAAEKPR